MHSADCNLPSGAQIPSRQTDSLDFCSFTLDCIRVHLTITHNMVHLCTKVALQAPSAQRHAAVAALSSSPASASKAAHKLSASSCTSCSPPQLRCFVAACCAAGDTYKRACMRADRIKVHSACAAAAQPNQHTLAAAGAAGAGRRKRCAAGAPHHIPPLPLQPAQDTVTINAWLHNGPRTRFLGVIFG